MTRNAGRSRAYSRRQYLQLAGTVYAGAAGSSAGEADSASADADPLGIFEDDGPNYEDYEGVEIGFATPTTYESIWEELAGRFEAETGIAVDVIAYDMGGMFDRLREQFRAGKTEFDAFIADVIWTGSFMAPGHVEPIGKHLEDPDLAMSDYEYGDHIDVFAENHGQWDGTIYGFPWYGDTMKLVVRKDVLEEYADEYRDEHGEEILPPFPEGYGSWEQFNRVASFLYEKGWDIGLEAKAGWNVVYTFPNRFAAETGEPSMITDDRESKLDRPGAKRALQHYVDQVEWGRNPLSTGYGESRDQFLDGQTWAVEQWQRPTRRFIDEYGWEEGVRVTLTPGGYPNLGGWGVLVSGFSGAERTEAAFLFAQWATSPEMDRRTFLDHGILPTRASSFTDDLKAGNPQARYHDPAENPGIRSLSLRPRDPDFVALGETMRRQIGRALTGDQGVQETIDTLHDRWQILLDD